MREERSSWWAPNLDQPCTATRLSPTSSSAFAEEHPSSQPQHHQLNESNHQPNNHQPGNQPTTNPKQQPNEHHQHPNHSTTNPMIDTDLHRPDAEADEANNGESGG